MQKDLFALLAFPTASLSIVSPPASLPINKRQRRRLCTEGRDRVGHGEEGGGGGTRSQGGGWWSQEQATGRRVMMPTGVEEGGGAAAASHGEEAATPIGAGEPVAGNGERAARPPPHLVCTTVSTKRCRQRRHRPWEVETVATS